MSTFARQNFYAVAVAVAGGTGMGLTSGSVHEAVRYGLALLTGIFIGLGLAKRSA